MADPSAEREPVGSVGQEAAKLLAALQGWAQDSGADHAEAAASAATGAFSGAASALHELGEHVATGSKDCRWCPVCRAIAAVRGIPPDVREHLTAAAGSLAQAVAGLLETQVPDDAPSPDRRPPEDEDVDDDRWED